jgi:hypothetical protein
MNAKRSVLSVAALGVVLLGVAALLSGCAVSHLMDLYGRDCIRGSAEDLLWTQGRDDDGPESTYAYDRKINASLAVRLHPFHCKAWTLDGKISTAENRPFRLSRDELMRPGAAQVMLVYKEHDYNNEDTSLLIKTAEGGSWGLHRLDPNVIFSHKISIPASANGYPGDIIGGWTYRAKGPAKSHRETGTCTGPGVCVVEHSSTQSTSVSIPSKTVDDGHGHSIYISGSTEYISVPVKTSSSESSDSCPGHNEQTVTTQVSERFFALDFVDPQDKRRILAHFESKPETVTRELSRRAISKCRVGR